MPFMNDPKHYRTGVSRVGLYYSGGLARLTVSVSTLHFTCEGNPDDNRTRVEVSASARHVESHVAYYGLELDLLLFKVL